MAFLRPQLTVSVLLGFTVAVVMSSAMSRSLDIDSLETRNQPIDLSAFDVSIILT